MFAVVTGGGTSGHVMPAVAILDQLKEAGHAPDDLAFVGARRGVETRLFANTDVRAEFLPVSGLQRSMSPRALLRNIAFPFRVIASRAMALRLLAKWKPRVVVSVGGYASDPVSFAAKVRGIPLVCVSYDRVAGLATRKQAKHATVCAVAFGDSSLPNAVVTGAPVRSELRHLDVSQRRRTAREALGVAHDAVMVTVMGGSLGSGVLNSAVPDIMSACADLGSVFVFHICGERFENHSIASKMPAGLVGYRSVGYETRMTDVYAATDLLVARAGASTVAEIATVGVASILVPWAQAVDNHQQLNAEWLGDASAAVVLSESSCTDGVLAAQVKRLAADHGARVALASASRRMGELHRGTALLGVIENAAR
jgi:UDP-N-acetylglucosamine--N-acetylmuramyl-(pentapeptide) pyrophosphoryl-undecaprenol N-acetylglucosamine transferase